MYGMKNMDVIALQEKDDEIWLEGSPFHKKSEKILQDYQNSSLDEFLKKEATSSAGDYIIVDTTADHVKIISSTQFAGGYVCPNEFLVSRTLSPLLQNINDIKLNSHYMVRFLEKKQTQIPPFSTIFKGVKRLLPGCVHFLNIKGKNSIRTYITQGDKPKNFSEAIKNTFSPLKKESSNKKITLMYSGGVDSTAFYYALNDVLGKDDFNIATVNLPSVYTNSSENANKIASKLGFELDFIDFPPTKKSTIRFIEKSLKKDIINPLNPHWSFFPDQENKIIISGQNMDSVSTIDMKRKQISFFKHFLATRDFGIIMDIVRNIQFTDTYLNNNLIQNFYARLFNIIYEKHSGMLGGEGCLMGMLSTGTPGRVNDKDQISKDELLKFLEICLSKNLKEKVEVLNYFYYQSNCNKLLTTFSINNSAIYLPSMWAPLLSYFLGKKRNLRDAFCPKEEIYKYVNKKSGKKYREIAFHSYAKYRKSHNLRKSLEKSYNTYLKPSILINNQSYFEPNNSLAIKLSGGQISIELERKYRDIQNRIKKPMVISKIGYAYRILNLEMLLESCISK
jgi:hypothetical protein